MEAASKPEPILEGGAPDADGGFITEFKKSFNAARNGEPVETTPADAAGSKKALLAIGIAVVAVWFGWGMVTGKSDATGAANVLQEFLKVPGSLSVLSTSVVFEGITEDGHKARIAKVDYTAQNTFGAAIRDCSYVAFWWKGSDSYFHRNSATWPCSERQDVAVMALKAANSFK